MAQPDIALENINLFASGVVVGWKASAGLKLQQH